MKRRRALRNALLHSLQQVTRLSKHPLLYLTFFLYTRRDVNQTSSNLVPTTATNVHQGYEDRKNDDDEKGGKVDDVVKNQFLVTSSRILKGFSSLCKASAFCALSPLHTIFARKRETRPFNNKTKTTTTRRPFL